MSAYSCRGNTVTPPSLSTLLRYMSSYVGETISDSIIRSTIWVHKSDLDRDGKVTEADFVLFKLQQMQKVRTNSRTT